MILFGSTIHTAKESYKILFPTIRDSMLPATEMSTVKKIMLKIIENDQLQPSDRQLPTTNVFILFKRQEKVEELPSHQLVELRNFKLSKSCRKFSIHFRDSTGFKVFEEFEEMSLSEPSVGSDPDDLEDGVWHQSKSFVKGVKENSWFSEIISGNPTAIQQD